MIINNHCHYIYTQRHSKAYLTMFCMIPTCKCPYWDENSKNPTKRSKFFPTMLTPKKVNRRIEFNKITSIAYIYVPFFQY